MKTKRTGALILAGAMVLSMVGCGGNGAATSDNTAASDSHTDAESVSSDASSGSDTSTGSVYVPNSDPANTEKTDEELVIGLSSEPSTLYGAAGGKTEDGDQIISGALLDSLVKYNYSTGEVEANLATAWEWVDDTHLKLTLRDDVTMTDGTPLVADDVVYTCNEIWVAQNQTNDIGKYLVGATADDDHTVTIEFNCVAPDFLTMMTWSSFGIVSEDEVNAAGGLEGVQKSPVIGSGRYKFVEWKNGEYVTLERNDNYWNDDYAGYFKTIKITFTSDAAAREMAVESGSADVAYDIPVNQAVTYVQNDSVTTTMYEFGQVLHLWYNMGDKAGATKDEKVRKAIDLALNFDAIAQVGTAGTSSPSLSYFGTGCEFYSENYTAEERAVDVETAKSLLAEAGYADGLELTVLNTSVYESVLTVIQANLAEIGITLTLNIPDTAQFVEESFGGDYDLICVGDTTNVRIPANIMPFLQSNNVYGTGMVIGGPKWTTDEFDSAISDLITAADTKTATEVATKLDNMIKEQTVCSNLYSEMHGAVFAKDIKGFNTRERGYIDITSLYK